MASLWHAVAGFGAFGPWLRLAEAAGWRSALLEDGPFTLLVPIDLAEPPAAEAQAWAIIAAHVLPGRLGAAELAGLDRVQTVAGVWHPVLPGERVCVAGALVIQGDLRGENGLIHVLDSWLPYPLPSPSGPA